MLITLATYRKGTNAAYLMEDSQTRRLMVMHEDRNGATQFPIRYNAPWSHPVIAYDYPERVPQYARALIERAYVALGALAFARKYPGWQSFDHKDRRLVNALDKLQESARVLVFDAGHQFRAV